MACYFLLENVALTLTSATAVGAICATSPLFCVLIAFARGQRPASPASFTVGFALAMGGILLVGSASNGSAFTGSAADNLIGCGLALVASVVWAGYSTLVSRIADAGYDTLAATKRIFAWGLLFMMPAIPFAGAFPALGLTDPLVVANLLFLGLGASAACFATWNCSHRRRRRPHHRRPHALEPHEEHLQTSPFNTRHAARQSVSVQEIAIGRT